MEFKNITVVGAGVMGIDVALDLACYNFKILLVDSDQAAIEKAADSIKKEFRMLKMMKPSVKNITIEDIFSKITMTTNLHDAKNADMVIENITEDVKLKKALYNELKKICRDDTTYAVNTSCIPITELASILPHPENVIGVHFMNPVPLNKMVETIRGFHTSKETEEKMVQFLKSINKNPVVVNDSPGFVANRLSHLFMNEAAFLVQDGVATPEQIDTIFKQGYGHKIGPLETADLIGLDTVAASLEVLYNNYQDSKFRCCPLLKKMVHAGLLGRKSGKGFYSY